MKMTSQARLGEKVARSGVRMVGLVLGALGLAIVGLAVFLVWIAVRKRLWSLLGCCFSVLSAHICYGSGEWR